MTLPTLIELASHHVVRVAGSCFLGGFAVACFAVLVFSGPDRP